MEILWDIVGTAALMLIAYAVGVNVGRKSGAGEGDVSGGYQPKGVGLREVQLAMREGFFDAELERAILRNATRREARGS